MFDKIMFKGAGNMLHRRKQQERKQVAHHNYRHGQIAAFKEPLTTELRIIRQSMSISYHMAYKSTRHVICLNTNFLIMF